MIKKRQRTGTVLLKKSSLTFRSYIRKPRVLDAQMWAPFFLGHFSLPLLPYPEFYHLIAVSTFPLSAGPQITGKWARRLSLIFPPFCCFRLTMKNTLERKK